MDALRGIIEHTRISNPLWTGKFLNLRVQFLPQFVLQTQISQGGIQCDETAPSSAVFMPKKYT